MVTLPVPVFVSVKACDTELPTRALPKFRLLTLEESKYDCVGVGDVPVPETETWAVTVPPEFRVALTAIVPLYVRAATGRNTT
jgi:hypothetical protein